jgi:LCCL domain
VRRRRDENDGSVRALALLCVLAALLLTASASLARPLALTWTGAWEREWGLMKLTRVGSKVTGTYPHDSGRLSGTVSGSKFKGRWDEAPGKCTAGRCLQNAGTVTGSATGTVEPKPWGTDWGDTAIVLRNQPGSRFVYVCPAGGRKDQVWGTHIYADNSSVCSAALHDGAFVYDDGAIVTIEHLGAQASFTGSTQNGITSASLGSWPGSFQIIGAEKGSDVTGVKMGGAGWTASATRFRGHTGVRYRYICPGNNAGTGAVYGANTYTDDSSVCTAAVLAGLITRADGGRVTITIAPGQSSYTSATNNGIQAQRFGRALGSFTLVGAPPVPGGGGGGGGGGTTTTTGGGGGAAPPPTGTPTGTVLVNGRPFTGGPIPYNSTVDVTNGRLLMRADTGTITVFGAGISAVFKLLRGKDKKQTVVEMRLIKGDFGVCPKRKKSSAGRIAATTVRQLWGDGSGRFRTRGRYASATVRGTKWLTADRCDGTFVKVDRGVIQVNDVPGRRQVTVSAPRSYLAKP